MADEEGELLAQIAKNSREELRLRRTQYNNVDLLDCRVWTLSAVPGGDSKPTKKGLCLRPATWSELVQALQIALGSGATTEAADEGDKEDPFS
jgi:hypothetical protein